MRNIRTLSACLSLLLLEACTTPNMTPLHYEIILPETPTEQAIQYIRMWEQNGGLNRPHSSFTIWKTSREYIHITTPISWNGNALRAKAEFKNNALQKLKANEFTPALPQERQHGEYHLFLNGKECDIRKTNPPLKPYHALCLIDLSGDAKKENAHAVMTLSFNTWLLHSKFTASSTWRVILVGRTRDTAQTLRAITIENHTPAHTYLLAHEQFQSIEFPHNPDQNGSAIIEALHYGISLFKEKDTVPHSVFISSDMREINHELDFSRKIPSTESFISWLQKESLTIDLHKASIFVHGISHTTSGNREYSAKEYETLITFWRKTLEGMNAGSVSIQSHGGDL